MHLNQFDKQEPDDQDAMLRDALHQVHTPNGLVDRLKAAVRQETDFRNSVSLSLANQASWQDGVLQPQPGAQFDQLEEPRWTMRQNNRRLFLRCVTAASFLGMGAGAAYCYFSTRSLEPTEVANYCLIRLGEIEKRQYDWVPMDEAHQSKLAAEFRHLRGRRLAGECDLPRDAFINNGRAYRLEPINGLGLILFDLKMSHNVKVLNASFVPLPTRSGGWSLVGMQERRRVLVLAGVCKEHTLLNVLGASTAV